MPSLVLDYLRAGVTSGLYDGDIMAREVANRLDTDAPALVVLVGVACEVASPSGRRVLLGALLDRMGLGAETSSTLCSCALIAVDGVAVDEALRAHVERTLTALRASGSHAMAYRRLVQALVQLLPAEQRIEVPLALAPAAATLRPWTGFAEHAAQPPASDAVLLVQSLVRERGSRPN